MTPEKKRISIEKEPLQTRLERALSIVRELTDKITDKDIESVESIARTLEKRAKGIPIDSEWYPMSGTIEEIEKALK